MPPVRTGHRRWWTSQSTIISAILDMTPAPASIVIVEMRGAITGVVGIPAATKLRTRGQTQLPQTAAPLLPNMARVPALCPMVVDEPHGPVAGESGSSSSAAKGAPEGAMGFRHWW